MGKQMIKRREASAEMPPAELCTNASISSEQDWDSINWDYHVLIVRKLQLRIAKATEERKFSKVKHLQWILTHSFSAKLLAVRDVLQNSGSNTPGVDGITIKTSEEKLALAKNLRRRDYKPLPLRRIYIPKAGNKKKLRPISIPSIRDRAMQSLHTQALLPVSEVTADQDSYGFRPNRSCADAIQQSFIRLAKQVSPQYILEGDIRGCFDNISHQWMLENICTDTVILKKWLKAGYVETDEWFPTHQGTGQGGIISPVLSNMTLDGLEEMLNSQFKGQKGVAFVRYADDFIVTAHSKEFLEYKVKPAIETFLKERGLELSQEKTVITHIKDGFDFLGQNVRKYPSNGKLKLLIKPSDKSIHSFKSGIKQTLHKARHITQAQLIHLLNPKITGWANYHKSVVSKETFRTLDHFIWHSVYRWAKRRHPNKGGRWVMQKYFKKIGGVNYRFSGMEDMGNGISREVTLKLMSSTPIRRHTKIRKDFHPYDPEYDAYYEMRTSDRWRGNSKRHTVNYVLSRDQANQCPCCLKKLTINQRWHISLRTKASLGGEFKFGNMDIIHASCQERWQEQRGNLKTCNRPSIEKTV
jgi:RNA-directed DNA polymerase